MTRILEIRDLDDCLGEELTKEIVLSSRLDEATMRRLASRGRLDFYPDFPRPYFRIEQDGAFVLQGVLGNTSLRATLSKRTKDRSIAAIERAINPEEERNG